MKKPKSIKELKEDLYNRREAIAAGSALALMGVATLGAGGALFK